MGIASNEKSFPRGGKKPAVAVPRKGRFRVSKMTADVLVDAQLAAGRVQETPQLVCCSVFGRN
jgi:hypothetical protein